MDLRSIAVLIVLEVLLGRGTTSRRRSHPSTPLEKSWNLATIRASTQHRGCQTRHAVAYQPSRLPNRDGQTSSAGCSQPLRAALIVLNCVQVGRINLILCDHQRQSS